MPYAVFLAASSIALSLSAEGPTPIIDFHAHLRLGEGDAVSRTHPIGTEALQALDDAAGVTRSALIVVARPGALAATRAQNDAVLAAAQSSGGRFYAVCSVHPADGAAAAAELDRVAALGVRVVKLHPNTQNFDVADPSVAALVTHAARLGLVLLFDSYKPWDPAEMGKFVKLAAGAPTARFVLAHMGFSQFRETLVFAELRRLGAVKNVWFDLSAIAAAYADSPVEAELVWTIRQIGTDRFLFGSDFPVDTPAVAADAVRRLGFSADEERQIFHANAAELLGLAKAVE